MQKFYRWDFQFLYNGCFTEHDRGKDGIARFLHITDEGVFYDDCLKEGGEATKTLRWKPVHELDGPNKPPSSGPALPFPFTANQLAAFMLWGWWGSHFQSVFGLLDCGPNEFVLNGDHEDAADAYEALRQAYVIYQDALHFVGELDQQDRQRAYDLRDQYANAYSQALERENVMERVIIGYRKDRSPEHGDFIPRDEYFPKLARAKETVAEREAQALQAEEQADAKERAWRRAMTRQLLQTQATTLSPMPVGTASDDRAPLKQKRRTWREVALPYMVELFKAGQYPTAKEFYRALEKKAGAGSPFDRGTGPNSDSIFVREISEKLTFKTIQNVAWPQLKKNR